MTKAHVSRSDPSIPVRGVELKKVTRRSDRLASRITGSNAHCRSDASLQGGPAPCTFIDKPHQNVHQPRLAVDTKDGQQLDQRFSQKILLRVAGRGTQDYCEWWRTQETFGLFDVRLIGDASSPQLFTPIAQNDLAYCRCASLCDWLFQLHALNRCTTKRSDLQCLCRQQVGS